MATEDGCMQSKKFQSVNIKTISSDNILLNNDSNIPNDGSFDGMIKITDRGTNVDNFNYGIDPQHSEKAGKIRENYCLLNLETNRTYHEEPKNNVGFLKVPSILKIKIPEGDVVLTSTLSGEGINKGTDHFRYKTNINAIDIENADIKFQQTSEDKELIKEQKIKKKTSHLTGNNFSIVIENEDKTESEEGQYTEDVPPYYVKTKGLPNNCLKLHNELGYIEFKSEIHSRGNDGLSGGDRTWNLPGGALKPGSTSSGGDDIESISTYTLISGDPVSYSQIRTNGEIITSIKVHLNGNGLTGLTYGGTAGEVSILGGSVSGSPINGSYIAQYEKDKMGLLYRYTINVIKAEDPGINFNSSSGTPNLILAFAGESETVGNPGSPVISNTAGIKLDLTKIGSMTEINNFVNDYNNVEDLFSDDENAPDKFIYLASYNYDDTATPVPDYQFIRAVVMIKLYGFIEEP